MATFGLATSTPSSLRAVSTVVSGWKTKTTLIHENIMLCLAVHSCDL